MNLTIRATYPATDGSAPESIEVEQTDVVANSVTMPYLTDHVVNVIRALAAATAGRPAAIAPPTVTIESPDPESLEIKVADLVIATFDHDTDGWAGMDRGVALARALTDELGGVLKDNR